MIEIRENGRMSLHRSCFTVGERAKFLKKVAHPGVGRGCYALTMRMIPSFISSPDPLLKNRGRGLEPLHSKVSSQRLLCRVFGITGAFGMQVGRQSLRTLLRLRYCFK